jgi:hypothetical protein
MPWLTRIRSAIAQRPLEWLGYLIVALYIGAALWSGFGPFGIFAAFLAWAILIRVIVSFHGRHPLYRLDEIGEIQMDIAECDPVGIFKKSSQRHFYLGTAALFGLLLIVQAGAALYSYLQGSEDWSHELADVAKQFVGGLGYAAIIYWSYRNTYRRALVTDKGLFRIVEPSRLWPSDRDIHEPGTPLRAITFHSWDDIANFHWSRQQGQHVLHLNVRQPGISVPQMISYRFPSLTEPQWHQFAQILQRYVAAPVAA